VNFRGVLRLCVQRFYILGEVEASPDFLISHSYLAYKVETRLSGERTTDLHTLHGKLVAPLQLIGKLMDIEETNPPSAVGLSTETLPDPFSARSSDVRFVVSAFWVMNVVVRNSPFQRITEPATNPVPFTAKRKGPLVPAFALAGVKGVPGEIVGASGASAFIWKGAAADSPPPGEGFVIVTCAIPGFATSPARIETASCPVLRFNVDVRGDPFHMAWVVLISPFPAIVSVKRSLPAVICGGKSWEI
jgi:hypothetical protein